MKVKKKYNVEVLCPQQLLNNYVYCFILFAVKMFFFYRGSTFLSPFSTQLALLCKPTKSRAEILLCFD